MSEVDEPSITQAVLDSFRNCPNPRLREVSESLVRHLHAFVREVEPTMEEWRTAIDFLTRTGQICSPSRQEFILLSDVLGVSMLVDAINHRFGEGVTESTVLGPFYVENPPEQPAGADISGDAPGERLLVECTVRSRSGEPVADALVDTWQSDAEGFYDVQRGDETQLRARFRTDRDGRVWFWSVIPSSYPIPNDGPVGELLRAQGRHPYRPAHVHFMIRHPGHETLVTHVFIAGDRYLDSDAVFGVKRSLIRDVERRSSGLDPAGRPIEGPHARLAYDFVLADAAGSMRR
ncbi:MAG TPA: intradiol ring-cleavage dioxygenase [Candidatus Dormibacteraeota bacterium]|nr:intradiol ring-cleavage dioxygenase [Candidatus Dormibacteraeota bacterium]